MQDAQEILDMLFKVQSERLEWEPDDPQVCVCNTCVCVYLCFCVCLPVSMFSFVCVYVCLYL